MGTQLRFCNTIPIDLIPCRIDDKDIEAKMTICWSASSKELSKSARLEGIWGGWYLESNKLIFPTLKKAVWIDFLTFLKIKSESLWYSKEIFSFHSRLLYLE